MLLLIRMMSKDLAFWAERQYLLTNMGGKKG